MENETSIEDFENLITEVLAVPSTSGHCERMRDHILDFAYENGLMYETDEAGNVCLTKGIITGKEKYVCLINHMDTVQSHLTDIVKESKLEIRSEKVKGRTVLTAYHDTPSGRSRTGIGADDKLGCAIAMTLIRDAKYLKCVFCVDEETGMQGSRKMPAKWFDDVSFCLSFDSPGRNRSAKTCSAEKLFSDKFFSKVLKKLASDHGVTQFRHEPWTDVVQVRRRFPDIMCWVVGNGGYDAHMSTEYVVLEDAYETYKLGRDFIDKLGLKFNMRISKFEIHCFDVFMNVFRRRYSKFRCNLKSPHNNTVNAVKGAFSSMCKISEVKPKKNVKNSKRTYNNTVRLEDVITGIDW